VCTISEVVQLGHHRLRWKELVECMVWIVLNFIEQFTVSLLQQLLKFRQIRLAEATSLASTQKRISTLAVRSMLVMLTSAAPRRLRGRRRAGRPLSSHDVVVHGAHITPGRSR